MPECPGVASNRDSEKEKQQGMVSRRAERLRTINKIISLIYLGPIKFTNYVQQIEINPIS